MWNILQAGLLTGATPVLYDGNPAWPDMNTLWRMAQDTGITYFGTSAAFITACMRQGMTPKKEFNKDYAKNSSAHKSWANELVDKLTLKGI
ncbi:MAG: hypothetical protein V1793_23200 [Pseudomonadota bacterium]